MNVWRGDSTAISELQELTLFCLLVRSLSGNPLVLSVLSHLTNM